jgi:hypothetical protein
MSILSMSITFHDATSSAFVVGLVGDILLNFSTQNLGYDFGLKKYFKHHGALEAMFIAAGLMWASMWLGLKLWPLDINHPDTVLFLFLFGSVVDVLFREYRLMPTLDGMYKSLHPFLSMIYAGGPLVLSYYAAKFYVTQR